MAASRLAHLRTVFSDLVWIRVAEALDPQTFVNFRTALPELESIITTRICVPALFPAVFHVLYQNKFLDFTDAKNCRRVCTKWSSGVDGYFQNTNFETIKNIDGARNQSDIVLTLPLRLEDIDRIYGFDLHPRCVSFEKKLTLEIDDWDGMFDRHRREVNALVQSVSSVWRHFEHLEIRRFGDLSVTPDWEDGPAVNEIRYLVPYGELGLAENVKVIHCLEKDKEAEAGGRNYYAVFKPDEFEIYIPFLEHLTNLKTVTFFLWNRHHLSQILLRIPRLGQLERIFMVGNLKNMQVSWLKVSTLVYQICYDKLTFLSGCEMRSLESYLRCAAASTPRNKFEALTELHLSISSIKDLNAMLRLTRSDLKVADFFPKLCILQIRFGSATVYANTMELVIQFVLQFPTTLCHFSITGHCIPTECIDLGQINGRKRLGDDGEPSVSDRTENRVNASSITTFQFECPSHVPLSVMRRFSLLKHVIVAEQPGRCRRRVSKSKDWKYIRGFFNLLGANVRTLTFVPASYNEDFEMLCFEPGAITCNRSDRRCWGRKRKRGGGSCGGGGDGGGGDTTV